MRLNSQTGHAFFEWEQPVVYLIAVILIGLPLGLAVIANLSEDYELLSELRRQRGEKVIVFRVMRK